MLAYLDHDNTAAAAAAQMWRRRRRGGGIFHDLLPQSSAPTDADGRTAGKGTKVRWNGRVRRRGRGRGGER